jgi:hypothetical protein
MAALALVVAISGAGTAVVAQDGQGQGGGQGRGQGQGQRQFDPEQARQRMMDNLRERLGASEEDWQALQPKVQAVMEAQQQARAGGMGMMMGGGRGGRGAGPGGPGGGDQDQSEMAVAARELRSALEDEATGNDVIAQRLESYRAARSKAEANLKTAREELKELVTQRQEATLVMMGMLE